MPQIALGAGYPVGGRAMWVWCCPVRGRAPARFSAPGGRNSPAIRRISRRPELGLSAVVTNSGRVAFPRRASTAWLAVRNLVVAADDGGT